MLKKLLTIVLPLALPFIVYFGYVLLARWHARKTGGEADVPRPWIWLTLAGVALMVTVLVGVRLFGEQGPAGSRIQPERYIDGEIRDSEIIE